MPQCAKCRAEFVSKARNSRARFCSRVCAGTGGRSVADRFWERVRKDGPEVRAGLGQCWTWTGTKRCGEYGGITIGNRECLAHRVSWTLAHGDPGESCVLHRCDNPSCVRPDHLFLGDLRANNEDRHAKGRNGDISGERNFLRQHPDRAVRGEDHPGSKLTVESVRALRAEYAGGGVRMVDLAQKYGCSYPVAQKVIRRKLWKHVD